MTENPLKKYSERPGTYVTLPSGGRYYDNPPKLTADGEIEIRPMTAADEIRLKNPDGLMNSDSLFQVIEHVVPGIQSGRDIPTPDLDLIVIGMRIATYGNEMNVGVKCSECGHDDDYTIDLMGVLANARSISAADSVEVNDLKINIRPHTSESNTMLNNYQVELVRAARAIEGAIAEEREPLNQQLADIINRGGDLLFQIASKHIVSVETPEGETVDNPEFIQEFLSDLPAPEYEIIRNAVQAISQECIDRKINFVCSNCGEKNQLEVAFDPANFFGNSSL